MTSKRQRIVILESEKSVSKLMKIVLEGQDFEVMDPESSDEQPQPLLNLLPLDLIITNRPQRCIGLGVPVLYLSTSPDETLARGCAGVLRKPFTPEELISAVEEVLRTGRRQRKSPPGELEQEAGNTLAEAEREHIVRIFLAANKNLSKAARILAIDRATLYAKLRRYGLK
jgi:DNA-binding NtrC family response regulator